jgi:CheY-like chemotaxis protein
VVQKIVRFAHKVPLERGPTPIGPTVRQALKLFRATIPATVEIREDLRCDSERILADPVEVQQLLMNLCANGVDALDGGGGLLEVRLDPVRLDPEAEESFGGVSTGDYVQLTVTDTGRGIDPAIIDRVFDPYFTTKDVDEGLGMGLAVVYGVVRQNDGGIAIESRLGKGTRVDVLFPLLKEQGAAAVPEGEGLPRGSERVLVVDDELPLLETTQRMLERLGYSVVATTSSGQALKWFRENPGAYDLVITDLAMPEMSGDQLAPQLVASRGDIPILLCTGRSDRMDAGLSRRLGIAACARKPMNRETLALTVREVLDRRKGGGPAEGNT